MTAGRPRVGLFGGTFDPVHAAHVALARAALDAFELDEVRWIPTGQPFAALVPPEVARYIESHGLYRTEAQRADRT